MIHSVLYKIWAKKAKHIIGRNSRIFNINALSGNAEGGTKMPIEKKIQQAKELVAKLNGIKDATTIRNDAANIFAESFEEYMTIWDALQEVEA
jgi:hypothetical protein